MHVGVDEAGQGDEPASVDEVIGPRVRAGILPDLADSAVLQNEKSVRDDPDLWIQRHKRGAAYRQRPGHGFILLGKSPRGGRYGA